MDIRANEDVNGTGLQKYVGLEEFSNTKLKLFSSWYIHIAYLFFSDRKENNPYLSTHCAKELTHEFLILWIIVEIRSGNWLPDCTANMSWGYDLHINMLVLVPFYWEAYGNKSFNYKLTEISSRKL